MDLDGRPSVWAPWGKFDGGVHPLLAHGIDVWAVVRHGYDVLLGPACRDEIAAALSPLGDVRGWAALIAGLHDLGKLSVFQAAIWPDAARRLGPAAAADLDRVRRPPGSRRVDTPHGIATALYLRDLLISWGAPRDSAELLAVAVGGHHGHFPGSEALRQAAREVNNHGPQAWRDWRTDLVHEAIKRCGLPAPDTLAWPDIQVSIGAALGIAALASVCDWIASDPDAFPRLGDDTDVDGYERRAAEQARAAIDRLGWRRWEPPRDTGFTRLFPDAGAPRPLQSVVARLTRNRDEPTLLLIEAPTGEGKSKAALQAAASLVGDLGLTGMYVAMPTRATSHQMLAEIETMLAKTGDPMPVRLHHSHASEYLEQRTVRPTDVGADDPDDSDVAAREWFTRKRGLLAPIGVGTVDQLLQAAIRSGHQFVRLVALSSKVVVIDEVHAYDTFMSTLLDRLLLWLGRLGVPVVMLSATLPASRRDELVRAWRAGLLRRQPRELPDVPASTAYPRVTSAAAGRVTVTGTETCALNASRAVTLTHLGDDDLAGWALDHAEDGRSVAVIHNLVRRAVTTHAELEERTARLPAARRPELIFITGQLPAVQRHRVEAELQARFGPGGSQPPAIVVGTQVIEQSLDLSLETMISDLAPVDSLLQRIGRLRRHRRDDSLAPPVLGITGVTDTPSGPELPRWTDAVYSPMIMLRTWALLRERNRIELPGEVPGLVDAVYGPAEAIPCPAGWEDAWKHAIERHERSRDREDHDARTRYLPPPTVLGALSEMTARRKDPSRTRKDRYRP